MKIIIDGDASNRITTTETIAKKYDVPVIVYCDTKRTVQTEYAEVKIADYGTDSVDFRIVNITNTGDIVITNDAGLAALALAKGAFVINNSGYMFTDSNINMHLNNRYVRKKAVKQTKRNQVKGTLYVKTNTKCSFNATLNRLIKENVR